MRDRSGVRACVWLLAMAFVALFLQRALPHHCSSGVHQEGLAAGEPVVKELCPLCDQALPVFEGGGTAALPMVHLLRGRLPVGTVAVVPHGPVRYQPVRGPPAA